MSSFNDLKKKARVAIDSITDVSVEAYNLAGEKTKGLARVAKLKTDISIENTRVRHLYSEIGAMYYNEHKNNPHVSYEQSCTEVTLSLERIKQMQIELDELRNSEENEGDI